MDEKKTIDSQDLENVSGGSMWIREEKAKACGIELLNEDGTPGEWGYLYNTGDYYLNGRKLTQNQTARLLDFYEANGYPAKTVEECQEYWYRVRTS